MGLVPPKPLLPLRPWYSLTCDDLPYGETIFTSLDEAEEAADALQAAYERLLYPCDFGISAWTVPPPRSNARLVGAELR